MKWFITSLFAVCIASSVSALDVQSAYVGKGYVYAQTNAGAPVLKPFPHIFEVAVRLSTSTTLYEASWSQPPFPGPGAWRFIPPSSKLPLLRSWIERSSSQSATDTAHPNGDYYIRLDTANDGWRTNRVLLSGSQYPPAPQISNFAAAQNINPDAGFTVQWNAITGARVSDLITFTVMEATNGTGIVFQTGTFPSAPSALDGTQTSVTLPAGTLNGGRVYLARLRYDRIVSVDTTNYPSEVGFASYFASTDFYLSTVGSDSNTAPRVIATYPPQGAVDVPPDAPLIWTFSKPMQRASGTFSTHVTDRATFWTTDRRNFVVVPVSGHATNVNITWQLQPWNSFVIFGDLLGNPLFTDVHSEFQTGTKLLLPAVQPRLGMPALVGNRIEMFLHGETNRVYAVQFSADLANWTYFSTNVTLTGPSLVTSPAASSSSHRFYRAVVLR